MDRLITADASTTSSLGFFDAITGSSPERREAQRQQHYESCIRAIERGDTRGYPPAMVEHCIGLMAERDTALTLTQSDPMKARAA